MLPVVLSVSFGSVTPIPLDALQKRELALTLSQSLLGALFLINMELAWWEATGLFVLFVLQFSGANVHVYVMWSYLAWCGLELVRVLAGRRKPRAIWQVRVVLAARK
jgi:hypothetical protein